MTAAAGYSHPVAPAPAEEVDMGLETVVVRVDPAEGMVRVAARARARAGVAVDEAAAMPVEAV